jgi:hypothetical protein
MQQTIKKSTLLEARIQAFLEKDGCTQGWGDSFLVAPHAEGLFGITEEGDAVEPLPPERVLENPNFARWFGDSKVVDSEGNPLVVYHGTDADILGFDMELIGSKSEKLRTGFFFTSSPQEASLYAINDNPNIIPVYLKIENPYIEECRHPAADWEWMKASRVINAKKNSHDGIIMRSPQQTMYVVFNPKQIKSIYNNGQFSTATDNISEEEIDENITGDAGFIQGHMYEGNPLDEESSGMGERYAPNTAYTFWQN